MPSNPAKPTSPPGCADWRALGRRGKPQQLGRIGHPNHQGFEAVGSVLKAEELGVGEAVGLIPPRVAEHPMAVVEAQQGGLFRKFSERS